MRSRERIDPRIDRSESLLRSLYRGRVDLLTMARDRAMTLRELVNWTRAPDVAESLASLLQLSDTRADLIVTRARIDAAASLLRLAADTAHPETARKACVDLLSLKPSRDHRADPRAEPRPATTNPVYSSSPTDRAPDHTDSRDNAPAPSPISDTAATLLEKLSAAAESLDPHGALP